MIATALLAACGDSGSEASPETTAAPAASEQDVTTTTAAGVQDMRTLSTPALFAPDEAAWEALADQAREEGMVAVHGNVTPPGLGEALSAAFEERYDVSVDFFTLPSGQLTPRVQQELSAGAVTVDLFMGGSCFTNNIAGILQNVRDLIIDPALFEDGVWEGDQMRPMYAEPGTPEDYYCGVQGGMYVMPDLFVNPEVVDPESITSWKDLLGEEFRGKIATFDPATGTGGPAGTTIGYLSATFGEDFVRQLITETDATFSTDLRQMSEWLVRGTHPIVLGLPHIFINDLVKEGLPAERVIPADGPGPLTAGFNAMSVIKDNPHPAAAQLFLNWYLSQEAQQIVTDFTLEPSLRTDVDESIVPDYVFPKEDFTYPVDDYSPTHFFTYRKPAQDMLKAVLGG